MSTETASRQTAFVLVVEDEEAHGEAIAEGLRRAGQACHVVASAQEAIDSIRKRPPDVVVTDYRLAGEAGPTGLDILREVKKASPESEVILITAYGSEQLAREALGGDGQVRAFDYLTKPVDLEDVREVVNRAAQRAIANREAKRLNERLREAVHFDGIVAGSPVMQRVLRIVRQISPTKITALILGETGTGKELIARAIHTNSTRKNKPYKVINCAGLNENLLESELFGHVRGAFTGAISERKGLLEAADGGTVFLDEGRRHAADHAGQTATRPGERRDPSGRIERGPPYGRAGDRRDQQGPPRTDQRRQVPRGPLLPAQPGIRPHPAAARAARRHPAPDSALHPVGQRRARPGNPGNHP